MHHLTEFFCLPEYALKSSVLFSMFLAGALGGVMHCSSMCGGFGLGFASYKYSKILPQEMSESKRFLASTLLPYHLGRITTYTTLGFLSAYVSSLVSSFEFFKYLRDTILIVALVIFLSSAFGFTVFKNKTNNFFGDFFSKISRKFFSKPEGFNLFFLGVILGFLPCAMVYSALLVAVSSGNPLVGASLVATFGLGTVIPLILTTYGFGFFIKKLKYDFKKTVSVLVIFNSFILIFILFKS